MTTARAVMTACAVKTACPVKTDCTSILLLASTAIGQGANYYVPSNTPATGTCNVIPFGNTFPTWKNLKYQCMATHAQIGKSQTLQICDLGFVPCGSGIASFESIEIVLAQTSATTLSTTFSTNLATNRKTVLSATDYHWHKTGDAFNRIGLDTPYNYAAGSHPNLVIQITLGKCTHSGGLGFRRHDATQRVFALDWSGTPPAAGATDKAALKFEVVSRTPDTHVFGLGCAGKPGVPTLGFSGPAKIGTSFKVTVGNCVASTTALHVFGMLRLGPGIDLSALGAPGCRLYPSLDVVLPTVANSSGTYSLGVPLPNDPRLVSVRFFTQAFPADASANAWKRTATPYGRILVGF